MQLIHIQNIHITYSQHKCSASKQKTQVNRVEYKVCYWSDMGETSNKSFIMTGFSTYLVINRCSKSSMLLIFYSTFISKSVITLTPPIVFETHNSAQTESVNGCCSHTDILTSHSKKLTGVNNNDFFLAASHPGCWYRFTITLS